MEEQQIELIGRAGEVFMRFGIKSVTMDDLARELGVSKKTLYKYFDDKNDLVKSVLRQRLEMEQMACIQCTQDGQNAIEELHNISEFVLDHLNGINPTVFFDLKKYHPDGWKLLNDHKWEFILNSFRANLERGIREGIYRDSLKVDIVARCYVASIDNMLEGQAYPFPEFKIDAVFKEIVELHVLGLVNDAGRRYIKEKYNNEFNEK